jgi:hypothetical protein
LINLELPFTFRFPSQHLLWASWLRFSLPSGAARRVSSRSSLSAINSAFFYEKVVKVKADVAAFISFSPLDPAADPRRYARVSQ